MNKNHKSAKTEDVRDFLKLARIMAVALGMTKTRATTDRNKMISDVHDRKPQSSLRCVNARLDPKFARYGR